MLSISTGERKVLLTGGVFGFYVPTGHLLYAVGETIRAVPFDLERLEVTGAAVPVVDSVAMNLTDGAAAFDVSENGTLAYLPVSSYVTETDVVLVDRQGKETPRPSHAAIATTTRASRLTAAASRWTSARPTRMGDVWVFQVGRSGGTRLTVGRRHGTSAPNGRPTAGS